jgi:uncharacterized protein YqfA (UPF0365 family)
LTRAPRRCPTYRAGIPRTFEQAAAIDLAGRGVLKEVQARAGSPPGQAPSDLEAEEN